jgi:hypothetical protein
MNFFYEEENKKKFPSLLHAIAAEFMDMDRFATLLLVQSLSISFCLS